MKASIVTGLGEFSSERMVEEYNRFFYEPAAASYRKLTADDAAFAKELVAEKERLVENFDGGKLYIERPAVEGDLADLHVGDKFKVSTRVYLAGSSRKKLKSKPTSAPSTRTMRSSPAARRKWSWRRRSTTTTTATAAN